MLEQARVGEATSSWEKGHEVKRRNEMREDWMNVTSGVLTMALVIVVVVVVNKMMRTVKMTRMVRFENDTFSIFAQKCRIKDELVNMSLPEAVKRCEVSARVCHGVQIREGRRWWWWWQWWLQWLWLSLWWRCCVREREFIVGSAEGEAQRVLEDNGQRDAGDQIVASRAP